MMTLYMVYRIDRDDGRAAAIREATRPAHRAYMDQFAARVRLGGPVLDAALLADFAGLSLALDLELAAD